MAGRNGNYYGANEKTVNLTDVTSSSENAIILQKLRDDDLGLTHLGIGERNDDENIFVVREGDDLGWLGYFIGGCTTLSYLNITYLPQENWRSLAFIRELVSNRSIDHLEISTDFGEDGFQSLGSLLKSDVLDTLEFNSYGFNNFDTIGLECGRNIAKMLDQPNQRNHIKTITFEDFIFVSAEAMAEIAAALSAHPQLEKLHLGWDGPGDRHGSVALGRVLGGWENPQLTDLWLCQENLDDEGLRALVAGMKNCHNLSKLTLLGDSITANGCRILSTLFVSDHFCLEHMHLDLRISGYCAVDSVTRLVQLRSRSLKSLSIRGSSIRNDWLSTLLPAIGSLGLLESLNLAGNMIGNEGAQALADGLANLPLLKELNLSRTSIGDDGVRALVEGILHCSSLSELSLSGNESITALGVESLPELFRSESCALTDLRFFGIRLGDDGAAALTDVLKGNHKLTTLMFDPRRLTSVGWSAFSKLLCETSSVNNTYLSNHTLTTIGGWQNGGTPDEVKQLLELNKYPDEHVAIHKILKSHSDFGVEPFFKWNLMFLPFVVSWLERVITLVHVDDHEWISEESVEAIQSRKLSTLYKFVRDMPGLATDARLYPTSLE
jgi:Ran GTPase-activating protein (RanGAP) involved in mRNA processing and transport